MPCSVLTSRHHELERDPQRGADSAAAPQPREGWKDSGIAITNADGSLASPPIALCEIQGYLYRAWISAARLLELTGESPRVRSLLSRADELRQRFERDLWSESLGCYVLAPQQGGRSAEVLASDAGPPTGGVQSPGMGGSRHAGYG